MRNAIFFRRRDTKILFGHLWPWLCLFLVLLPAFPAHAMATRAAFRLPAGFVYVTDAVPGVMLDMRYYGSDNFVGARVDGYRAPVAILTKEAATALKKARDALSAQGYEIKILDAYRPASAVAYFVRWCEEPVNKERRARFYPALSKAELFRQGYIARSSGHSRGSAVDLTLVDRKTGLELDMGTAFDFFDRSSHHDSATITPKQAANRSILRNAMEGAGFRAIRTEWWHYILASEPHPKTFFDFPVDSPAPPLPRHITERLSQLATDKAIIVLGSDSDPTMRLYAWEQTSEGWQERYRTPGFAGAKGMQSRRHEGSLQTPTGVYGFGPAFGIADDPGSQTPYTKLREGDQWVDDPASRYYNRWARADQPDRDWKTAENLWLETTAYRYVIALDYNTGPVVPGAGSAIFLHCSTGRATAGCVSVPEGIMIELLRFIDNRTKIVLAASEEELAALLR